MKKIIIKEIDILTSKKHKNRIIIEYLIYLMENDVKLACYIEIGDESKDNRLNKLINNNFGGIYTGIIEEIKMKLNE